MFRSFAMTLLVLLLAAVDSCNPAVRAFLYVMFGTGFNPWELKQFVRIWLPEQRLTPEEAQYFYRLGGVRNFSYELSHAVRIDQSDQFKQIGSGATYNPFLTVGSLLLMTLLWWLLSFWLYSLVSKKIQAHVFNRPDLWRISFKVTATIAALFLFCLLGAVALGEVSHQPAVFIVFWCLLFVDLLFRIAGEMRSKPFPATSVTNELS